MDRSSGSFRPEQLSEYVAHFDDYTYISGYNQVLKTWNGYCLDTDGDGENEDIFTYSMVSYEHGGLPVITGINEAVLEKISH